MKAVDWVAESEDRVMLHWEKKEVLRPAEIEPSCPGLRVVGTFNPGAVHVGDEVVLLVRVAEASAEQRRGEVALPRWREGHVVEDRVPSEHLEPVDARVVRSISRGSVRLTSVSHLRAVRVSADAIADPDSYRVASARLLPLGESEEYGIEDPRITRIGERYYITYVAVSQHGACTALASTTDFRSFERHGIIFPPENKDVVLFPRRIDGRHAALHRPVGATPFTTPEMWIGFSEDLVHWGDHQPLHGGGEAWESGRVGAGTPPLETEHGWLELFHGNRQPTRAGDVGEYCAGGMLLAADDPRRVVRTTRKPIMMPDQEFELRGFVPRVVFPTAVIELGEQLGIYYGAADTSTAVAMCSRADLLHLLSSQGDG